MNNIPPFQLRCEYLENPLGIDVRKPGFSWLLNHREMNQHQRAYQIIVSSSIELVSSNKGDMWDSGRVKSESTYGVEYNGKPLENASRYFWKIRWWDSNNDTSPYSETAFFGTGLYKNEDWKAKWIGMKNPRVFHSGGTILLNKDFGKYTNTHCIYLRKEFFVRKKIKRATVYICGLGLYVLYINGNRIGKNVLDPGQTDYNKIALYSSYDVTNNLLEHNAIGVMLGNGRHIKNYGYSFPKLIMQMVIEHEDGSREPIITDKSWQVSHGPLKENGLYYGELYDARLEMPGWDMPQFDDSSWENAVSMKGATLASQAAPPIRATHSIKPIKITSPSDGVYIFDFGQNFTGWTRLTVQGPSGTEVKMRHAELLNDDGTLNISPNQGAEATDIYILKGEGQEIYEPRFTYHGFRYVEVTGFPGAPTLDNLDGIFVHSDVPEVSSFYCSNEIINAIHRNCWWGQLSNLMSIPTDCPQRDERYGWLGDAHLAAESAMFRFDMAAFYTKYLRDIKLAQNEDGGLPDTVPLYLGRLYPADPAWSTAYITIAWYMYEFYGDRKILDEHYESMKKYVEFLRKNSDNNIIYKLGKYGDWCPPGSIVPKKTPVELTSTWYYYMDTLNLSRIASVLENKKDALRYEILSDEIKSAFNKKFLVKDQYAAHRVSKMDFQASQTSNTLPLYSNMVPPSMKRKVLAKLVDNVVRSQDYHIDTGIIGARYILDVLTDNGYGEVAYKVATNKTYPGWGYMIEEGATTLWERWEKITGGGMNSHNHVMFASVDAWFYRAVAGLSLLAPGWAKIRIKPPLFPDLKFASAELQTIHGIVRVSWRKSESVFHMHVYIPVGTKAEINVPILNDGISIECNGIKVFKRGKILDTKCNIKFAGIKDGYLVISAGSGCYIFKAQ